MVSLGLKWEQEHRPCCPRDPPCPGRGRGACSTCCRQQPSVLGAPFLTHRMRQRPERPLPQPQSRCAASHLGLLIPVPTWAIRARFSHWAPVTDTGAGAKTTMPEVSRLTCSTAQVLYAATDAASNGEPGGAGCRGLPQGRPSLGGCFPQGRLFHKPPRLPASFLLTVQVFVRELFFSVPARLAQGGYKQPGPRKLPQASERRVWSPSRSAPLTCRYACPRSTGRVEGNLAQRPFQPALLRPSCVRRRQRQV